MVEHNPWVGHTFEHSDQKIAILGYSHYLGGGRDHDGMTTEMITSLVDRSHAEHAENKNILFFKKVSDSFGISDCAAFWNSVTFMNLVPEAVGGPDEKYDWASHALAEAGSRRLFSVLAKHRVEKLFAFSDKAWKSLPATVLPADLPITEKNPYGFNTFVTSPDTVAFHLRHPQFATPLELEQLGEAVAFAMKQPKSWFQTAIERSKQS